MIIRALDPAEWQTYRAVRLAALRDAPEAFSGTIGYTLGLSEQDWRARCTEWSWFAFDGEGDGLAAIGMVRLWRHDGTDLPELISMWVAPRARGTAAATELVAALLDRSRSAGDAGVSLRVLTTNPRAEAFYRRMGFEPNGITDTLPDGRAEIGMERRFEATRGGHRASD